MTPDYDYSTDESSSSDADLGFSDAFFIVVIVVILTPVTRCVLTLLSNLAAVVFSLLAAGFRQLANLLTRPAQIALD